MLHFHLTKLCRKTLVCVFALLLSCMLALPAMAEGATFSQDRTLIDKAGESILLLTVYNKSGTAIATGSGFVVFDNMTLVTNYHVIDGAYSITASSDGGNTTYKLKYVLVCDKTKDLAILQFAQDNGLAALPYDVSPVSRGEKVWAIGYPLGLTNYTLSEGIVSSCYEDDDKEWIQITAPISHGSSGGALFNDQGSVIGVTSAGYTRGENMNLAINFNEVLAMYRSWDGETRHAIKDYKQAKYTPAKKATPAPTMTPAPTPTPEPTPNDGSWSCPDCGRRNKGNYCGQCGHRPEQWNCPECETVNRTKFCVGCGTARPDGASFATDESRAEQIVAQWVCPTCGQKNDREYCSACGKERAFWKCEVCGKVNTGSYCELCGQQREDAALRRSKAVAAPGELSGLTPESWTCPSCYTVNAALFCGECGSKLATWTCGKCATANYGDFCTHCGMANQALAYDQGVKLYAKGKYTEAAAAFERAGDYYDAPEYIQKAWLSEGEILMALESYEKAVEAFGKAGSYMNAAARRNTARFAWVEALLAEKRYSEARALAETMVQEEVPGAQELLDKIVVPTPEPTKAATDWPNKEDIKVGNTIKFGRYPQTADGTDMTPIDWMVLDVNNNHALLLSKRILDYQPFYTGKWTREKNTVTWSGSTIRKWLNSTFFNKAFTQDEQKAILTTSVDNSVAQGSSYYLAKKGSATNDKVFLLSFSEAHKYLKLGKSPNQSAVAPRAMGTAYAKAKGLPYRKDFKTSDGKYASEWWLRSPGWNTWSGWSGYFALTIE